MKNVIMVLFSAVLFLPVIAFPFNAAGAPAQESGGTFNNVEGKEWFLSEIKSAGKTISIDRKELAAANMGGYYTISFREGRASGTGAPNRYFASYTTGSNRGLGIGNIASTMMAPFREPDNLKENEYFNYLPRVARWNLREGKLELYCSNSNGGEAILIFIP